MAVLALLVMLGSVVRLCALVAFMTWLYRVTKNLPALGVSDPDVTPGWAIGCWFVPFINLFAPCIVVLRVWRASGPASTAGPPDRAQNWPLLYVWWGAFIVLIVAVLAVFWFSRSASSPPVEIELPTRGQIWAYLCSSLASIVMSLLAIRVVREIERRQTEKSQLQAFV
jgi:hypothetical protein